MTDEFGNRVNSLFTGDESGLLLKTKLEEVERLLTGLSNNVTLNQQKTFLEVVETVLYFGVKTITEKLLLIPHAEEDISATTAIDRSLIRDCLVVVLSIVVKSVTIYTSLQSFQIEYISRVFGPPIVKLYLIFQDKSILPSKDESVVSSLMTFFLKVVQKPTLKDYLSWISNPLYVKILKLFTANLTRDLWKLYPFTCLAYGSLISLTRREKLSNALSTVLPPILLLVDDFQSNFVVLGLETLRKILSLVPGAEMRMYGWADVIYDAVFKKLYLRDVAILNICLPCLLAVLKVLERDPKKADKPRTLTRYDDVFQLLISNLSMISDNKVLSVLWMHIPSYIEVMGITTLRHLKDLVELLEYHLKVGYLEHLPYILQTIETTITVAWIRSKRHTAKLLKLLLNLALRINLNGCEDNRIYDGIRKCVTLLYQCNKALVTVTLARVGKLPEWSKGRLYQIIKLPIFVGSAEQSKY